MTWVTKGYELLDQVFFTFFDRQLTVAGSPLYLAREREGERESSDYCTLATARERESRLPRAHIAL
jgi:hypothetical protein